MTVHEIKSNIPADVKLFSYAKNHHYLKLRDKNGNETMLIEHGLVRYGCTKCSFTFFADTHQANVCPRCAARELSAHWTRPQVALVPEEATDFEFVIEPEDTGPTGE